MLFRSLPAELGRLLRLDELLLESNPLVVPPPDVVALGTAAVLEFLRGPHRPR